MRKLALALAILASAAAMANSKGDKLVQEIDTLPRPPFDQSKYHDRTYRKDYLAKYNAYLHQKNELILQLYETDPANPKTLDLMIERWLHFEVGPDVKDSKTLTRIVNADIDKVLAQKPSEIIRQAGDFARVILDSELDPPANAKGAAEAFRTKIAVETENYIAKYPKSNFSAELLFSESIDMEDGPSKTKLYQRIVDSYPRFRNAAMIKGSLAQAELVGKAIRLAFDDAITGKHIDLANMKGKVVLLDFWATWCSPCISEMPQIKNIYSQFHDKGVEIIGVSLDLAPKDGGLSRLKKFVSDKQIPWPTYYQGGKNAFSERLGVISIPTMFIVDRHGNFRGQIDPTASDFQDQIDKLLVQ